MIHHRLVILLLVSLGLGGCGYHLRGSAPFFDETHSVYLQTSNDLIFDEMAVHIRDSGTTIASTKDEADAVLRLGKEAFSKRTLAVDPDTGKEREFELSYSVSFALIKSDGEVLAENQTVKVLRDYVFDDDQVIGKSREQEVLKKEMRRDAVSQILTRLSLVLTDP